MSKDQMQMLIQFFNFQTGTAFRFSTARNQISVEQAIERAGGEIGRVKEHIRKYASEHKGKEVSLVDCFDSFWIEAKPEPKAVEEPKTVDTAMNAKTAIDFLGAAVVDILSKTKTDEIQKAVIDSCEQKVREFIKSEYGTIERKVVTVVDGKRFEGEGVTHEKFDTIIKFVANNEPVFLTGPAGSGKNVLCQQVAKALGLNFYFSNAVTQEYKITGFTDAMGVFHESQFYKAFKNGGLFMLDEMDASIPEVLVILNAAIANRYFDFPAPIGYVEAHPDFRVIAAGNTFGLGANY